MGKTGKIGYKIKPEIDNTQVYCADRAASHFLCIPMPVLVMFLSDVLVRMFLRCKCQ